MSPAERLAWLRLARTEQVGPVTFAQLLDREGTAQAALDALPELARRGGRSGPLRIPSPQDAERELAAGERIGWVAMLRHAGVKWRAYMAAPLFPLVAVLVISVPVSVAGFLLLRLDWTVWPVVVFGWVVLLPLACLIEWWRRG